jgi:hypothetical protein
VFQALLVGEDLEDLLDLLDLEEKWDPVEKQVREDRKDDLGQTVCSTEHMQIVLLCLL